MSHNIFHTVPKLRNVDKDLLRARTKFVSGNFTELLTSSSFWRKLEVLLVKPQIALFPVSFLLDIPGDSARVVANVESKSQRLTSHLEHRVT